MEHNRVVEKRIRWVDLPRPLTAAIEKRTGSIIAGHAVTAGQNSPLAAMVETRSGRVFVKGLPSGHRLPITQAREAAALRTYVDDRDDAAIFAGTTLAHTDWMPDNVLISRDRAWLVDWAWARHRGARIGRRPREYT